LRVVIAAHGAHLNRFCHCISPTAIPPHLMRDWLRL
jgi:hypothetical protein